MKTLGGSTTINGITVRSTVVVVVVVVVVVLVIVVVVAVVVVVVVVVVVIVIVCYCYDTIITIVIRLFAQLSLLLYCNSLIDYHH